ncbi:unnamed protein product [Oikopleura dioica]|uniref:Uncharacterized protein n=1 Tax=Oikopleura dioica TaxID=34765 RepID=E4X611_OIKDI|nr:unnamed protein product [Oikopleura dioica]
MRRLGLCRSLLAKSPTTWKASVIKVFIKQSTSFLATENRISDKQSITNIFYNYEHHNKILVLNNRKLMSAKHH